MDKIILKSKDGKILASSLEVAKKFGKRHDSILRDIDKILESDLNLQKHFVLSTYKNSRGRIYRAYALDKTAQNILYTKYKYSTMSPRFEIKFLNLLKEMFPSEIIIPQYQILNYRIDFFMPNLCMIIEYDEEQHKYIQEKDEIRTKNILNELNRMVVNGEPLYNGDKYEPAPWLKGKNLFSVIRIKKGKEIDGLRRLCIEITENTMNPCSNYMT